MTEPDPALADLVARLDADRREFFEERAAIREFDGGLPRDRAECLALLDVLRLNPLALTGLTVLRMREGSTTRVVLSTDPTDARGLASQVVDLSRVVSEFGGTAELTRRR